MDKRCNDCKFEDCQCVDDLYHEAKEMVIKAKKCNTTFLSRRLRISWGRAFGLMQELEKGGVISPQKGSKPPKILLK